MALTFPIPDLFDRFPIQTTAFALNFRQSFSRDGAGRLTTIDFRLPYWQASFVTAPMREDDCLALEALLSSLDGMTRTFLARDTRRPFPRRGPQSAAYGAATITAFGTGRRDVSFSGLPAGLVLSEGDYFGINISGSARLFRLAQSKTATLGSVSNLECRPSIPSAVAANTPVIFARPTCTMKVDPASIAFNPGGNLLGTVAFSAVEAI